MYAIPQVSISPGPTWGRWGPRPRWLPDGSAEDPPSVAWGTSPPGSPENICIYKFYFELQAMWDDDNYPIDKINKYVG